MGKDLRVSRQSEPPIRNRRFSANLLINDRGETIIRDSVDKWTAWQKHTKIAITCLECPPKVVSGRIIVKEETDGWWWLAVRHTMCTWNPQKLPAFNRIFIKYEIKHCVNPPPAHGIHFFVGTRQNNNSTTSFRLKKPSPRTRVLLPSSTFQGIRVQEVGIFYCPTVVKLLVYWLL